MSDSLPQQDLDLSFLNEIADGSNEFIIESIDMLLQQAPELLEVMGKGINAGDWPSVAASAHKLKPSLGFFGMLNSQGLVQEIEILSKAGGQDCSQISEKFKQVSEIISDTLNELVRVKAEKEAEL